jgi:hypothetical protein
VVSNADWQTGIPRPEYCRLVAIDGTSQEAEAVGLLMQLQEILTNIQNAYDGLGAPIRDRNWMILDSMACVYTFIAASGGDWGPVNDVPDTSAL